MLGFHEFETPSALTPGGSRVIIKGMNHRLELAIKDAIQNDMEEVETALRDLYYIYQNSGKRLRELRSLHEILEEL